MSEVVTDVPSARSPSTPWVHCPSCGALGSAKTWNRGLRVGPDCGHHAAVTAPDRLGQLLDPGSVRLLPEVARHDVDPLSFRTRGRTRTCEIALHERAPLILVCASGGAG